MQLEQNAVAPLPASSSALGRMDTNSSGRQINTSSHSIGDAPAKKSSTKAEPPIGNTKSQSEAARKASVTSEPTKKAESIKAASTVHLDSREEQKTEELNRSH
mmetsp:Transcript_22304/g.29869  ORF Transcript_22304/g.29869 Transcript_22304/m.29869 type:complete len:103 (+) Transcript_22304:905-1213(+)